MGTSSELQAQGYCLEPLPHVVYCLHQGAGNDDGATKYLAALLAKHRSMLLMNMQLAYSGRLNPKGSCPQSGHQDSSPRRTAAPTTAEGDRPKQGSTPDSGGQLQEKSTPLSLFAEGIGQAKPFPRVAPRPEGRGLQPSPRSGAGPPFTVYACAHPPATLLPSPLHPGVQRDWPSLAIREKRLLPLPPRESPHRDQKASDPERRMFRNRRMANQMQL